MPKITRTPEEIQEFKDTILAEAVELITTMGFNNMSMRKLASRLGMTAANIYNYYSSKDELYLDIQTNGFNILYDQCINLAASISDPREKLAHIIREYLRFGMENPHCYDIIFSLNTPKFADYLNTEIEPAAFSEKQAGLSYINSIIEIANEIFPEKESGSEDIQFMIIELWTQLHGIVSLYNSRVLQEVEEDIDALISKLVKNIFKNWS